MTALLSPKATRMRHVLGILLFAAIVGAGIALEMMAGWDDVLGWLTIVFGGLALIGWLAASARGAAKR